VDLIPVPELALVLAMALVGLGLRTLVRLARVPFARRTVRSRQPRAHGLETETERMRARLVASCVLFAIISIPLILGAVPPNGVYGFRIALTRSNPAIWYQANAFMGWALLVAAVISATLLVMLPTTVKRWWLWATFVVPVFSAVVASFMYVKQFS
jgi:hypothetical protein